MTEDFWSSCRTPKLMLRHLGSETRAGEREYRLLAVACWRRVWDLLDDRIRSLVEAQGAFADGRILGTDLARVRFKIIALRDSPIPEGPEFRAQAIGISGFGITYRMDEVIEAALGLAGRKGVNLSGVRPLSSEESRLIRLALRAQANLFREIFGNPFRPSTIDPSWLSWNGGTIPGLAEAIYQERAFDRLPILADALEEAGCADAAVLSHCRVESGHVRGCWALDALLGRR